MWIRKIIFISTFFSFFSCNGRIKKNEEINNSNVNNKIIIDTTNTKKVKDLDSNNVVLESFDTVFTEKGISQIERLKLDNDEIIFITKFKGSKTTDVLSIRNYEGLKFIFKGDTVNNFIKSIQGIPLNNSIAFLPVFQGDSIDNINGFKYKKVLSNKYNFWILNGYFYACNGLFCNNGVILILREDLYKKSCNAFLIGVRRDLVDLDSIRFFTKENNLFLKANVGQDNKMVLLQIFNSGIKLVDKQYSLLLKNGFFCIK